MTFSERRAGANVYVPISDPGAICVATRVNWFGNCHESWNKRLFSSRGLSVNTLTHDKPHGIDIDTRRESVVDSGRKMSDDEDDNAEIQYSTCPNLRVSTSTFERGQGHSDGVAAVTSAM